MSDGVDPAAVPITEGDPEPAEKKKKKIDKSVDTRQLEPWERYRALLDLLDMYIDLSELADRKTRFAMVILGALNALNFLVVMRGSVLTGGASGEPLGLWQTAYLGIYAFVSLYAFFQAISALKPRVRRLLSRPELGPTGGAGLRHIGCIVDEGPETYYERWRQVEVGQLNREMALQVQSVAQGNVSKYRSLNLLYVALLVLVFMSVLFFTILGLTYGQ